VFSSWVKDYQRILVEQLLKLFPLTVLLYKDAKMNAMVSTTSSASTSSLQEILQPM